MLSSGGQIVQLAEARASKAAAVPDTTATPRVGYEPDVPRGGTSPTNQGGDYPTGDRASFCQEAFGAYLACPWISAPVDVLARTVTAGGVTVEPDATGDQADVEVKNAPPQVQKLLRLTTWVNPDEDMIQLMRGVSSDLDIYGDSFTEVVWLLGEPVALYSLDASTMSVAADVHGNVTGYWQLVDTQSKVWFEPAQVIHVSEDNPRGKLYGTGLVQKAFWSVTTYLFAAGLLKERMRKGDPPDLHVDAPIEQSDGEFRAWLQQHKIKNVGAANIGNPIATKGGFQISELATSARQDLVAIMGAQRDTIISLSGVPPAQVGIIESGNLGGGTGTSQWRSFMVNRVAPRAALIMEKFNFALCRAFGIAGWVLAFGHIDYADDETQETIYLNRVKCGIWSLNEARKALGLPPVDGGDDHIMVERSWVMSWDKMQDFSDSWVVKNGGVNYPPHNGTGFSPPNPNLPPALAPGAGPPAPPTPDGKPPPPPAGEPAPDDENESSWYRGVVEHYTALMRPEEP